MHEIEYTARFQERNPSVAHYLTQHEINDVARFTHPSAESLCAPLLFNNMWVGIERLKLFMEQLASDVRKEPHTARIIGLKVDPDVDGFTSAAYMLKFISFIANEYGVEENYDIVPMLSPNKEHGLDECSIHLLLGQEPHEVIPGSGIRLPT